MKSETRNVPTLRFPGFDDNWRVIRLGNFIRIRSGNSPSNYDLRNEGIIPFLKVEDLNYSEKYQTDSREYSNIAANELVPARSVIFPKRGAAILSNKVRINTTPVLMDTNLMSITPESPDLDVEFLYYSIYWKKLYTIADTSTIPQINNKHIKPLPVELPSAGEQQKIAGFLSALDVKIGQVTRKKKLLLKYKEGFMQQIFTQKIRFKDDDGNDFPDWEPIELKEVSQRVKQKNTSGEISLVLTNSASMGIVSQSDYFDKDIANPKSLSNYYIVDRDDFVYNPRISTAAPVGPIKRNKFDTGVMSPLYMVFRLRGVSLDFFEYFFETNLWHDYMKSIANFGARHDRMNITTKSFFEMPVLVPSLGEQEKISRILRVLDSRIELVNQQLENIKTFKKGLFQQMFI